MISSSQPSMFQIGVSLRAKRTGAERVDWITWCPGCILPPIMGSNKVESRPKGGAPRLNASIIPESLRRNNVVSALLCFTCGACFVLSLICTCLATLVVLLDHTVEAASYGRHGEKIHGVKHPVVCQVKRSPHSIRTYAYCVALINYVSVSLVREERIVFLRFRKENDGTRGIQVGCSTTVYSACLCIVNSASNVTGLS